MKDCNSCAEKCPQAELAHQAALGRTYATNELVAILKKVESGELAPVVRCKDCNRGHLKHIRGEPCIECQLFHHEDPRQYKDLMDYCSHGVRKDGDNDGL